MQFRPRPPVYARPMAVPEPPAGGPGQGAASSLPATLAARVEEIVHAAEREAAVLQRDLDAHRRDCEAEAQRYLDEARRQADALVQRRVQRLRELTDELVERAEATRRHFDGLITALEGTTTRLVQDQQSQPAAQLPDSRRAPRPAPPAAPAVPPDEDARQGPAALRAAIRRPDELIGPAPSSRPRSHSRAAGAEAEEGGGASGGRPGAARSRAAGRRASAQPRPREGDGDEPRLEAGSAASLEAARLVAIEMAVAGRTRAEVDDHLRESFRITATAELLDDVFGGGSGETTRTSWVTP